MEPAIARLIDQGVLGALVVIMGGCLVYLVRRFIGYLEQQAVFQAAERDKCMDVQVKSVGVLQQLHTTIESQGVVQTERDRVAEERRAALTESLKDVRDEIRRIKTST